MASAARPVGGRPTPADLAALAADEPRTTLALAAALTARSPRHVRMLRAGPAGRSRCVLLHVEAGVWVAHPLLAHPDDAPALGGALDRSPALGIEGAPGDVDPLLPHVGRRGPVSTLERILVPAVPAGWPEPAPDVRLATALDLPALAELFEGYELRFGRTARSLRRELRDAVRRLGVVVAEAEGGAGLDGAIVCGGATPTFLVWSQLTVRPTARGRGISWALLSRVAALHAAIDRQFLATIAPTNPMAVPPGVGQVDEHRSVDLALPRRVPGEGALRRLALRADRRRWTRPANRARP